MTSLASRLRYLRDCWRADGRTGGVVDLFARKVEHLQFLDEREPIFAGELHPFPVDRGTFEPAMKTAEIYRRERNLVYGAFLLMGKPAVAARDDAGEEEDEEEAGGDGPSRWPKVVCAPLVLAPADLTEDPDYPHGLLPLRVELAEVRFNFAVLTALLGDEERASAAVETLLGELPEPPWGPDAGRRIAELLEELLPGADVQSLESFPDLLDGPAVRRAVGAIERSPRRGPESVRALPAAMVAVTPNSADVRGVLYELSEMASEEETSQPLRLLLEPAEPGEGLDALLASEAAPSAGREASAEPPLRPPPDPGVVPAVLSEAQRQVVNSARRYPLTVVVGPPGTGKSYTLAAVALEHLSRGERVLVAARTQQALDVVAEKVETLAGDRSILLRGGARKHLTELKDHLRHRLQGGMGRDPAEGRSLAKLSHGLHRIERRLANLEARLERRAEAELRWGERETLRDSGWWGVLEAVIQPVATWRLGRLPPPWRLMEEYEALLEDRLRRASELLRASIHRRLEDALRRHRPQLRLFLSALTARQSSLQDLRFGQVNLPVVLSSFPLWLTSFQAVHRVLPRVPELFDLVIIDEATQCDPASVLPVILRGRRLLVTGDPKQLRHLSFLSRERQRVLADRHGLTTQERELLDYRSRSLLDLATEAAERQEQVAFLDEHFRSTPQIIGFSNRAFYRNSLRVMTRRPDTVERSSLRVVTVAGHREPAGHNPAEAERLMEELKRRIEDEASSLQAARASSLGVLSPFRDQAVYLGERVRHEVGTRALRRHHLQVGTPWAFQGEERDVMLLSLALDDDSPAGAFRYLERPDMFNVAVTRARSLQLVFCSFDLRHAPVGELASTYLDYARESPGLDPAGDDPTADTFLAEVRSALEDRGFRTWPAYPVAGLVLDLMLEKRGHTLAVDLIGHPGVYAGAFELERCRILRRAGLDLFPLPFSLWRRDPERALEAIERRCHA